MSKLYLKSTKKFFLLLNVMTVTIALLSMPVASIAQGLVFNNHTLDKGEEGKDGAVYKFPNVADGVDGYVKIAGRSSSRVTLSSIDLENTGWDKAFQPQVSYKNGSAYGSQKDWWMEFEISFVSSITKTPVSIASMDLTAIDIDGDDEDLNEWVSLYNLDSYTTERRTSLNVSDLLESILNLLSLTGKKFSGPTKQYDNIDTSATKLMTTAKYTNKSKLRLRAGGHSDDNDISTERMYSFWFKSFNYSAPVNSSLPVVLNAFTVKKNGTQALLNWSTDMEQDVSHFVVERSLNGKDFSEAGLIFTEGNSSVRKEYSFKDEMKHITAQLVYYRLKIVDLDGSYKQSPVRILRIAEDKGTASITVYPNPAANDVRITLSSAWQHQEVTIQVINLNGQAVLQLTNARPGQTAALNVQDLAPGIYIVQVSNGKEKATQRFIKANNR